MYYRRCQMVSGLGSSNLGHGGCRNCGGYRITDGRVIYRLGSRLNLKHPQTLGYIRCWDCCIGAELFRQRLLS